MAFGPSVVVDLLGPRIGFVGTTVASALSSFTVTLALAAVPYRRFGVPPFSSATVRTFAALLVGVLSRAARHSR